MTYFTSTTLLEVKQIQIGLDTSQRRTEFTVNVLSVLSVAIFPEPMAPMGHLMLLK